jgi:COX assembly mitochondrial protein 2
MTCTGGACLPRCIHIYIPKTILVGVYPQYSHPGIACNASDLSSFVMHVRRHGVQWLTLVGCEEIMNALDECHARGFLFKAVGGCNDIKREVNKCLSGERSKKSGKNRETGLQRRHRIEAVWAKMDEGDYSALEEFTKRK